MGILSAIVKSTVRTVADRGIKAVENTGVKLIQNTRDGMEKLGEVVTGKSFASDIIKRSKKNCLIINYILNPKITLLNWIKSIFIYRYRFLDYYYILDGHSNIEYKVKYKDLGKNFRKVELYNKNEEKMGYIDIQNFRGNAESIRTVALFINEKQRINLKKYKNSNNIYASMEQGNVEINYNNLNAYELKSENRTIGKLHLTKIPKSDKYLEKYVLEYENKENEVLDLLLSVAIDLLNDIKN